MSQSAPRRSLRQQAIQLSIPDGITKESVEQNLEELALELGLLYNGKPSKSAVLIAIAQLSPAAKEVLINLLRANG